MGLWKDGWVYGRLKEEFDLQPDELNKLATVLGFKYGWNSSVENILEDQWKKEEIRWKEQELRSAKNRLAARQVRDKLVYDTMEKLKAIESLDYLEDNWTDLEGLLIKLILKMKVSDQYRLLELILERYPF